MKNEIKFVIIKSGRAKNDREERKMRRALISLVACAMMSVLLIGCGQKKLPTESELEIGKKDTVTSALVESFEKDFYDLEEFRDMAALEIALYNEAAGEERISLKRLELQEEPVLPC